MRKNLVLIFLNEERFRILYNGNDSVGRCDTVVIIILKDLESPRLGDRKLHPRKIGKEAGVGLLLATWWVSPRSGVDSRCSEVAGLRADRWGSVFALLATCPGASQHWRHLAGD